MDQKDKGKDRPAHFHINTDVIEYQNKRNEE